MWGGHEQVALRLLFALGDEPTFLPRVEHNRVLFVLGLSTLHASLVNERD